MPTGEILISAVDEPGDDRDGDAPVLVPAPGPEREPEPEPEPADTDDVDQPGAPPAEVPPPTPAPPAGAEPGTAEPAPAVRAAAAALVAGARPEPGDAEAAPPPDPVLLAVEKLRGHVAQLPLTYDLPDAAAARDVRTNLLGQLDDYLLPRLRRRDAPLLAVIGGSTGAGKSTLTNSLVRREVSRSGVLRPTTRSPVLVHHPADSGAFLTQRILPGLKRVTSEAPEPMQPIDPEAPRITGLRLVPHDGLVPGIALIDAPDIDSLVDTNRDLAVQLLAAADLWIFVTTAARYADAMPWAMLRQAVERGVTVAVVLDRVPPESLQDLRVHLAGRLRERGLGSAPVFTVPESEIVDGFLPETVVAPLLAWLRRVAEDPRSREMIAGRTLKGVIASLPPRARSLADAADVQTTAAAELAEVLGTAAADARRALARRLTDGSLMRGEVAARWQDFTADGGLVKRLEETGRQRGLGGRIAARLRGGGEAPGTALSAAVVEAVGDSIRAAGRAAHDAATTGWRQHRAGPPLLRTRGHLIALGDGDAQPRQAAHAWRGYVQELAENVTDTARGAGFRTVPDADTVAAVLLVAAISPEEGDAEGDVHSAAASAAAQRVLGAVVGPGRVREALNAARADLAARAEQVLDGDRGRLEKLLDARTGMPGRGEALRETAALLEEAR